MTEVQPNDFTIHVEYYGRGKEVVYDELHAFRVRERDHLEIPILQTIIAHTHVSLIRIIQEMKIQWRKNHWKDTTKLLMPIVEELTVENHDLYQDIDELKNEKLDLEAEVEELHSQISWELTKNGGI